MNLLPRAKIWYPMSVLERVCIIEVVLEEKYENFSVHGKLFLLERCPYGDVQL